MGGDLNEIKDRSEKCESRARTKGSFKNFRDFIRGLNSTEVNFMGMSWIWANNREEEGFVEELLDHFLASPD